LARARPHRNYYHVAPRRSGEATFGPAELLFLFNEVAIVGGGQFMDCRRSRDARLHGLLLIAAAAASLAPQLVTRLGSGPAIALRAPSRGAGVGNRVGDDDAHSEAGPHRRHSAHSWARGADLDGLGHELRRRAAERLASAGLAPAGSSEPG
jgi:hypothetical protein